MGKDQQFPTTWNISQINSALKKPVLAIPALRHICDLPDIAKIWNWPSDVSQIQENKISLTPVEPDLFWRGNLDDLPKINNSFVNPS